MTDAEREAVVARALLTPVGKQKLAQSMFQPAPTCAVCGRFYGDFVAHCDMAGDPEHLAASVMST